MPWILILLLLILTVSIIVILVSKKKEEPKKICSDYTYNNECVSSCGDKFVDEEKRICYDSIPEGKFAFEKKIVSSCNDKYKYGKTCLISCGDKYIDETSKTCYDSNSIPDGKFLDGNKIVSSCGEKYIDGQMCVDTCNNRPENIITDGKNCVSVCDKFLIENTNGDNICASSCEYYYIHDMFNRMGVHANYCLIPNMVSIIDMKNLFINQDGTKFVFELIHNEEDTQQIYLQKGQESKELNPYVFADSQNILKFLRISPDGNTYAFVYSDHVDVYTQDVFRSQSITPLRINNPLADSIIEECFVYDNKNLIISIRKENSSTEVFCKMYHIAIIDYENKLVQNYSILEQTKDSNNYYTDLKSAVEIEKKEDESFSNIKYRVGYINKTTTQDPTYIFYDFYTDKTTNTNLPTNKQEQSIFSSDNIVYDTKISKDIGVIFFNNVTTKEMRFRVLADNTTESDVDNSIVSFPVVSNNNQVYYAKINNVGDITIYRRYYDAINNTFPSNSVFSFRSSYSYNVKVNLTCNTQGTKLFLSIIDVTVDNSIISKELYKIDVSATGVLENLESILSSI